MTFVNLYLDSPAQLFSQEALQFLLAKQQSKLDHPKRYDSPGRAQEFYARKRAPVDTHDIPVERYGVALKHIRQMRRYDSAGKRGFSPRAQIQANSAQPFPLGWESLGPGNVGGRTRSLLIDTHNPSTFYAAGVTGGIWKTTDAGASWTPLTDSITNLAVNSMAMDPTDSGVLYAGTGEGYFVHDEVRGDGIFKSTNSGASWEHLTATANNADFHFVNDIVISTNNPQVVYAATRTGVHRSDNGGASWSQVHGVKVDGGCLDLAIRTDLNPDNLLVACGSFKTATVYRSVNGGADWQAVLSESGMGRTSLAIVPSNQAVVYAAAASIDTTGDFEDGLHAVFRSVDGGQNWEARVRNSDPNKLNTVLFTNSLFAFFPECSPGSQASFINQGWYDNTIAVDPVNADIVWVGGIDLFRSDDAGLNWGTASYWWDADVPQYAHADHHVIVFPPNYDGSTIKNMVVGTDGGVFRTDDARAAVATGDQAPCKTSNSSVNWSSLNNGYGVTQFYDGVPYPDGKTYFGGTQDNGTIRSSDSTGANGWSEILDGDGGVVAVDPDNTEILYAGNTDFEFEKSLNGGRTFRSATVGISEPSNQFLFIAPFVLDPNDPRTLWAGGTLLWRTTNQADSWVQASDNLPGAGSVSALAVAPGDSERVIAGLEDGYIVSNQNSLSAAANTQWTSAQPANGFVSSLAFDPTNKDIAYATYSTFGVAHVWKSIDAGLSWAAIDRSGQTNGIPDIPAHSIVIDPKEGDRLFVGTDMGVFVTTDGGQTWLVDNTGFANVVTEKLAYTNHQGDETLFAFTHGRGAFRVPLNRAPQLVDVIGDQHVTEAQAFNLDIAAKFNDEDGDPLVYSATGLPNGFILSEAGVISGTPTKEHAQLSPFAVGLSAADARGAQAIANFSVAVTAATPSDPADGANGDSTNKETPGRGGGAMYPLLFIMVIIRCVRHRRKKIVAYSGFHSLKEQNELTRTTRISSVLSL